MTTATNIQGTTDTRFHGVEDAFRENFDRFPEVGAALCVYVDGKPVVDVWGGHADAARTRPWERDTVVNVWSTTKGIVAACAHRLVDQGMIDLDAPVARYWPEFAQTGKDSLPVRYLLSHQAGLPAISDPMPMGSAFKWDVMTDALARQAPLWEPGTQFGYHALTYGWLVGEVIRRVSGQSVGQYWRDEIATPLSLDFWIGLPDEFEPRVAEMIPAVMPTDPDNFLLKMIADPNSIGFKMMTNPPDMMLPNTVNTREWRRAEIPAANGHGTARAVARLYAALSRGGELDGVQVMSRGAIDRATVEQAHGIDAVMGVEGNIALGFVLYPNTGPQVFGHSGSGGSLGFADPNARVGLGYAMNRMLQGNTIEDPRWQPLIAAVYDALK